MNNLIKGCFQGKYEILEGFDDLPKVGQKYNKYICIDVQIEDFDNCYICYAVRFCEVDSMCYLDDMYTDCHTEYYAVLNEAAVCLQALCQKGGF